MGKRCLALGAVAVLAVSLASAGMARSAATLPGIVSPTGNIKCLFVPGSNGNASRLLCSIGRASYAKKLQSKCMGADGSGVDWHGFTLTATGKGNISCSGGILYNPTTQHPRYVKLPYGKTWKQGVFSCTSRITGITCSNRSGHGLSIARLAWRAW